MVLSPAVQTWRDRGRIVPSAGHDAFVVEMGEGPAVLILHGFPGSTYDWHTVMPALALRGFRAVSFDLLGHGFTEKPHTRYSLFEQADLAEAIARAVGIEQCTLVAHDVGDTVAAELLARSREGSVGFVIERSIITNGSIFSDLVELSPGQLALLSLPDEVLAESLPLEGLKPGLAATFGTPPSNAQLDAMLELIREGNGDRVLPRVIRYIEERRENQERWTAAFVDYPGPLTAVWGAKDPIAVVAMPDHLKALRPDTEVVVFEECGHWPCIEEPDRLTEAIVERAAP